MNLIAHHGALGDFVLAWPLLRGLATPSSGHAVAPTTLLVAHASKAKLAARFIPRLEPCDIESSMWTRLFAPDGASNWPDTWRDRLPRVRQVVSFVSDGADVWAANIRRLAPSASHAFITPRPPDDWPGHAVDWHAHELARQGVALSPALITRRAGGEAIVVHAGSGGRDKRWPPDRFAELITRLRDAGHTARPILGVDDLDMWGGDGEPWLERVDGELVTSLDALADHLLDARCFIGNDSGPTHLAAQLGVPTVALFGPTSPTRWAPRGPAVTVIAPPQPAPMNWITVDHALREASERAAAVRGRTHPPSG